MMAAPLTAFGPIKQVQVPAGWSGPCPSRYNDLRQWTQFFNEAVPDASINLFYRGVPIEIDSARLFSTFLHTTPAPGARELSDDEKAQLSELLGPQNAGNNQFTNEHAPVFHLDSAKVGWLGKSPGLFVRGRFNHAEGPGDDLNEFCGVFLPSGKDRREIYEIFLQAPGLEAFERCNADFEATIQSLVLI